jgi:hypothetical protein
MTPSPFESGVNFSEDEVEAMSIEIGEILGILKDRNVFDLERQRPIILLDRSMSNIRFEKTELLEVHRFTALVTEHIEALTYLVRNPNSSVHSENVVRGDRIMGALNYPQTRRLRQKEWGSAMKVVCSEIHRGYNTPENKALALILFAIVAYCDRFLSMEELVYSKAKPSPTIEKLKIIKANASILLSVKHIKETLAGVIESPQEFDHILAQIQGRLVEGRIPYHFSGILKLFYQWRKLIYVALEDEEIIKHVLKYHFMTPGNKNDLFECWVFCKVLLEASTMFSLKFDDVPSPNSAATFRSEDGSLRISYQVKYGTGWKDGEELIEDRPDIVLTLRGGNIIVIDAKNSDYEKSTTPYPYREPMDSYLESACATAGVIVYSRPMTPFWKEIIKDRKRMIWTSTSTTTQKLTSDNVQRILRLLTQ